MLMGFFKLSEVHPEDLALTEWGEKGGAILYIIDTLYQIRTLVKLNTRTKS